MTAEELCRLKAFALTLDLEEMAWLADEVLLLRATIEQQAAWLREITTERDALKCLASDRTAQLQDFNEELCRARVRADKAEAERDALKLRVAELEMRS